ncbi:MAG: hypothetical protein KDK30_03420 [Leptospiraceae bacterium]|nr:hypothetical protein [Leptospiraceae bacterium]
MTDYTIWTLNRAADMLSASNLRDELCFIVGKGGNRCVFGDRKPSVWNQGKGKQKEFSYSLMYEQEPFDEYFVPIAVKCIGRFFEPAAVQEILKERAEQVDQKLLKNIREYNQKQGQKDWLQFWQEDVLTRPGSRMNTKDGIGLYEILLRSPNNILIGYSQGGLVARYLAFLDEHVFKQNAITAVITVGAPNYGSPLADAQNKAGIQAAVGEMVATLLYMYGEPYSKTIRAFRDDFKLNTVLAMLEDTVLGLRAQNSLNDTEKKVQCVAEAAWKWAGGLADNPNNAFSDLRLCNMDGDESGNFSVLSLVNRPAYRLNRIRLAVVINADNNINVLLNQATGDFYRRVLVPHIFQGLKFMRNTITANLGRVSVLMNELMTEHAYLSDAANSGNAPGKNKDAERIRKLLHEGGEYRQEFSQHTVTHTFRPHCGDLVIPAVYQTLPPDAPTQHPVVVNLKSNHWSGFQVNINTAGKANFNAVKKMLKDMRAIWQTTM